MENSENLDIQKIQVQSKARLEKVTNKIKELELLEDCSSLGAMAGIPESVKKDQERRQKISEQINDLYCDSAELETKIKVIDELSYRALEKVVLYRNKKRRSQKITDDTHTPPVTASELAEKLKIALPTVSNSQRPLGKFFKKYKDEQNTRSPRLPFDELFPLARTASIRSRQENSDQEELNDIDDLIGLFISKKQKRCKEL